MVLERYGGHTERNGFMETIRCTCTVLTDCRTVTYGYHFRFRIKTILDKINEHLDPRPRPLQNLRLENGKFCPSRCFILDLRGGGGVCFCVLFCPLRAVKQKPHLSVAN